MRLLGARSEELARHVRELLSRNRLRASEDHNLVWHASNQYNWGPEVIGGPE